MNKAALLAWLGIAIPICALFGPALVSDCSFAMRDAAHFYYPLFEWCGREWAAGRVPLWNPYENCGLPVLADTTSSVFYPGKLLFLLPLDFALRYKLYVVMHVVLAAGSSYFLARLWNASHFAAALAAIAYACGGNVVFQYCNIVFLVGAAWLPLAALAADRMLNRKSWRWAVALAAILALMVLGGDPQAAYHGLFIAGLYAVMLAFVKEDRTADELVESEFAAVRHGNWITPLLVRLALTALAAVFTFLLAAVQILPSSEATKFSERAAFNRPRNIYEAAAVALQPADARQPRGETQSQSIVGGIFSNPEDRSHHDLVYDFSIGPWRLVEYIWPNIGGRMFPTNRRWLAILPAEGRTWTPTLYLGLLPLVLACSSCRLRAGSARQRWLSWLVLIFTLASFGYYGFGWLLREAYGTLLRQDATKLNIAPPVGGVYWLLVTLLPTYVYFRYPAKLLPLVSLGLTQLAASGFDRGFAERRPRLERGLLVLAIIGGAAAFVVWSIGPTLFSQIARSDPSVGPFDGNGAYCDVLFALLQAAGVALAGRWLLMKAWREAAKAQQWQLAALLLTAVELTIANAWLVVTAPADVWRSESPIAAAIRSEAGDFSEVPPRVFRGNLASWRPPRFRQTISKDRLAELARWEHDTLFPKYELASGISLVESYGSIKLMDYESLFFVARQHGPLQPDKSHLPQPTALRLAGTALLVLPENQQPEFAERIAGGESVWPESAALWRLQQTMPRAWVVHHVEVMPPLPRPLRIEAVDERTAAVLFPNDKARDFLRTAVVETDQPRAEWTQQHAFDGTAEPCQITHYDPQHVVIEAELERPGLLVLSDAWFPGWKAVVASAGDSREVPIYPTNRVFRGVWLPVGKHRVEFVFRSETFVRGAAMSAGSWIALAMFSIVLILRRVKLSSSIPA